MSMSTQKTNVLEYDYIRMYSSMSTITLECNHDYWYFHDSFNECFYRKGDLHGIRCHSFSVAVPISSVLTDYC